MAKVEQIGRRLTPYQRLILAQAGEARWFDLPRPWSPQPGRQALMAEVLVSTFGLLEAVPGHAGAYQLTTLGERVAGWYLLEAMHLVDQAAQVLGWLTPLQRTALAFVATRQAVPVTAFPSMRHAIIARGLACSEFGVLRITGDPGQSVYTLTSLGSAVADAMVDAGDQE